MNTDAFYIALNAEQTNNGRLENVPNSWILGPDAKKKEKKNQY